MIRRRTLAEVSDEDLAIHPSDEPFVAQMKLLRRDLRDDKRGRKRFERRQTVVVVIQGVAIVGMVAAGLTYVEDQRDQDDRRCEERAAGRESTKDAIVSGVSRGSVAAMETLLQVAGAEDDPRGQALIENTDVNVRRDVRKILEAELPPVVCS